MPFTFSHPAIVLPATLLPKRFYSLTGLIIGSTAPDFEYFIRMKGLSTYSHRISGILWFDLPLGLLLAFVFHGIIRDTLVSNLPKIFGARLARFCNFSWTDYFKKHWLIVIVSLMVGAASHIIWDGFTHDNGFFVRHSAELQQQIWLVDYSYPLSEILQHLSSVVGGVFILLFILQLPKDEQYKSSFNLNYWITTIFISLIIIAYRVFVGLDYREFHETIVTVISCGLMAITVTSWIFRTKVAPLRKGGS